MLLVVGILAMLFSPMVVTVGIFALVFLMLIYAKLCDIEVVLSNNP